MNKIGNVIIDLMQELSEISTGTSVKIRLNQNVADPRQFKQLFNYFARGTYLEHINLDVETFQPSLECSCGYSSKIDSLEKGYAKCPRCGKFAEINDHSYEIVHPAPNGIKKSNVDSF